MSIDIVAVWRVKEGKPVGKLHLRYGRPDMGRAQMKTRCDKTMTYRYDETHHAVDISCTFAEDEWPDLPRCKYCLRDVPVLLRFVDAERRRLEVFRDGRSER